MRVMNHVCHVEYFVEDIARAQKFYEGLFGWNFRSFFEGMVIFGQGETHIGGLMQKDEFTVGDTPSIWYQVESLDDMIAKAKSLGGSADEEKSPVPGVGVSTVVKDPDGNLVGLVQYD